MGKFGKAGLAALVAAPLLAIGLMTSTPAQAGDRFSIGISNYGFGFGYSNFGGHRGYGRRGFRGRHHHHGPRVGIGFNFYQPYYRSYYAPRYVYGPPPPPYYGPYRRGVRVQNNYYYNSPPPVAQGYQDPAYSQAPPAQGYQDPAYNQAPPAYNQAPPPATNAPTELTPQTGVSNPYGYAYYGPGN